MGSDIINRRHIFHLPPWPTISKNECTWRQVLATQWNNQEQITIQGHNECYYFITPCSSVSLIWSLFFLFFLVYVCIYACADVDMYALCMLNICACPCGGQKSTLDAILQMLSTFFEIGSLADLVLTGSSASASSIPEVQMCTTRPGLHGCMASFSLTEPFPQIWFFFLSPGPSRTLVKFFKSYLCIFLSLYVSA